MKHEEQLNLLLNAKERRPDLQGKTAHPEGQDVPLPVRRLIPVPQFNRYHPDPSPAALRWMIFTNKDGFNRCVVRRGRRVLIDELEYFRWLDELNGR